MLFSPEIWSYELKPDTNAPENLFNPIAYDILRLSQLRGGFLSHTPENNVKIT